MPAGEFNPVASHLTTGLRAAARTCLSPLTPAITRPASSAPGDPSLRIEFAELLGAAPIPRKTDLEMVEDLLERCWRELGASELNAKMADIVRLLEFKNKLRATEDAERTFWAIINHIRREELSDFGLLPPPDSPIEEESPLPVRN